MNIEYYNASNTCIGSQRHLTLCLVITYTPRPRLIGIHVLTLALNVVHLTLFGNHCRYLFWITYTHALKGIYFVDSCSEKCSPTLIVDSCLEYIHIHTHWSPLVDSFYDWCIEIRTFNWNPYFGPCYKIYRGLHLLESACRLMLWMTYKITLIGIQLSTCIISTV
jgi:hypothetical protein